MSNSQFTVAADQSLTKTLRFPVLACFLVTALYLLANALLYEGVIDLVKSAANPFFAVLIITVTVLGQLIALYQVTRIMREVGLIQRVKNALADHVDAQQEAQEAEVSRVLGSAPKGLAAWTLFASFRDGHSRAQGYTQATLDKQVKNFDDAVNRRGILPSYISNNLIGLGLFGTFLGLIVTLKEVANLIGLFASTGNMDSADMMGQFFQQMRGPLMGMGEAFVASLLGLGGSIINGLQVLAFKKLQKNASMAAEASYFEVAEAIYGPSTTDAEGKQVALDVRLAQLQLEEISALRYDISKQTDAILVAASKMRLASDGMGKTMEMLERLATQEDVRPDFNRLAITMEQRLDKLVTKFDDALQVQHELLAVGKDANVKMVGVEQKTTEVAREISSVNAQIVAFRRDVETAGAEGRKATLESADQLKEALHQDLNVLVATAGEGVRVSREQVQTLTEVSSQVKQSHMQLKAMEAAMQRAIEKMQPQVVEMIARLEKSEQTNEYVAKYDWSALHSKVDKLQASLANG